MGESITEQFAMGNEQKANENVIILLLC